VKLTTVRDTTVSVAELADCQSTTHRLLAVDARRGRAARRRVSVTVDVDVETDHPAGYSCWRSAICSTHKLLSFGHRHGLSINSAKSQCRNRPLNERCVPLRLNINSSLRRFHGRHGTLEHRRLRLTEYFRLCFMQ